MKKGQIVGLTLLILGFLLVMLYSTIKSLLEIKIANIPLCGIIAIIIGAIALLASIIFEQTKDMKKRKEEIKKEEFEP